MKQPKLILHPTDLSLSAKPALMESIMLAKKFGAALHIIHVAPTFGEDPLRNAFKVAVDESRFYRTLRDEMDERMRAVLGTLDISGVAIKRIHTRGYAPAQVIVEYAIDEHIDLIVMGTHGYRGLRRMVLGSVTTEVVRNAPCDVLTVRNVTGISNEHRPVKHVVVPLDMASSSTILLREGFDIANMFSARLSIIHVIEPILFPTWPIGSMSLNELLPSRKTHARDQLEDFVKSVAGHEAQADIDILEGKPALQILDYAKQKACDMIVLAPRGSGWVDQLPLGSVAERVMANSDLPVYLVHLPDQAERKGERHKEESVTASPS